MTESGIKSMVGRGGSGQHTADALMCERQEGERRSSQPWFRGCNYVESGPPRGFLPTHGSELDRFLLPRQLENTDVFGRIGPMSLATIRTDDSTTEPDRPTVRAPRFTASLADGLGDRVLMHDGLSTSLELLRFKREFSDSPAFEAALRDRTALVRTLEHPSIAPIRSVDRRGTYDGLTLSSSILEGRRLSEMLKAARGSAFALDFLGQVGPALVALQDLGPGVVHGALTVDRVVVAREGRLVVTEHVLGSALATLGLSPARLRSEIGVAVPDGDGTVLIDARLDVIQLGFIALSLLVGRRLDASDFPAKVEAHLDAFANDDAAAAARLRPWLERALQQGA